MSEWKDYDKEKPKDGQLIAFYSMNGKYGVGVYTSLWNAFRKWYPLPDIPEKTGFEKAWEKILSDEKASEEMLDPQDYARAAWDLAMASRSSDKTAEAFMKTLCRSGMHYHFEDMWFSPGAIIKIFNGVKNYLES